MKHLIRSLAAGAAALALLPATQAAAQCYHDGDQITVVVPAGSGGTYHLYSQLLSRHLGSHIGPEVTVVTQNRPGAGGAKAARYMATAAPKDGSFIAMINPGSITVPLMDPDIGYDTREMAWLGSMSWRSYTVGVWHEVPVETLEDVKARETVMGTTGKTATSALVPAFINETLGTRFKVISGYKGGGAINLAIERGEVEGRGNFYSGYLGVRPEWIRDNKIRFLAVLGPMREELEGIPRLRDMLTEETHKRMLDLLEVSFDVGQAFYAPPGTPTTCVNSLRMAFQATMTDPALEKETKEKRLPLNWQKHREVQSKIDKAFEAPEDAVKEMARITGFAKR